MLLRDPAAIVESVVARRADGDRDAAVAEVAGYARRLDAARRALPCLTIRYEDLTSDPAAVTQLVCAHLGVGWEPTMLDYGRFDHGTFRPFAGDWSEKIRSGSIQPARRPSGSAPPDGRTLESGAFGAGEGRAGAGMVLVPAGKNRAFFPI